MNKLRALSLIRCSIASICKQLLKTFPAWCCCATTLNCYSVQLQRILLVRGKSPKKSCSKGLTRESPNQIQNAHTIFKSKNGIFIGFEWKQLLTVFAERKYCEFRLQQISKRILIFFLHIYLICKTTASYTIFIHPHLARIWWILNWNSLSYSRFPKRFLYNRHENVRTIPPTSI